ncbi:MAG: adenine deaminase [Desulfurococcaceae archaeon]
MSLFFKKYEIEERVSLIETALGHRSADLVLSNANLVDVNRGEILEGVAILIKGKRIAGVIKSNDVARFKGPETVVIDVRNAYIMPGFIDLHIHIESSLLDPVGFSKIVLKHGTTTVVADPHEIVNVLGLRGFRLFADVSMKTPLKILLEIPSCVPPTNPEMGLETVPNIMIVEHIKEAASYPNIIGLGEVMDFISVLNRNRELIEKINVAYRNQLLVDGHAPLLTGYELNAYIASGIMSDHESTDIDEAIEKTARGMYLYIRQGSAWQDLPSLIDIVKKNDCKLCAFVSDDVNVLDLFNKGHMDRIINQAIELGLDPVKAIQYATINPALRLHLEDHIGIIGPGRLGDVVISSKLSRIEPRMVLANGEIIYYEGEFMKNLEPYIYPDYALNTVKLEIEKLNNTDLQLKVSKEIDEIKVNVIEVKPGSTLTKHVIEKLRVINGIIQVDYDRDIMYVGVIDRHTGKGGFSVGFIKGLAFKASAIAQTIAHDTHNLIFAGWNIENIKLAIKRLVEIQGGVVIVDHGDILAEIPLKLAGLMSIEQPEIVYEKYNDMIEKLYKTSVEVEAFFMTLSLVSLPVIPELRITDKGLINVRDGKIISVIAS